MNASMQMIKRAIFIFVFFIFSFFAFGETRTFYFARHGQRGDPKYQRKFKHCYEDALMPNGEKQAELLGQYMNSLGFKGTIYVSPYYRTLQTATCAASKLPDALPMVLEPRVQELCGVKDNSGIVRKNKNCITRKEIKENFPRVQIPRGMKFPWRLENERQFQTDQRISDLIDDIMKNEDGDVFIVAHGGVMGSVVREMQRRGANFPNTKAYNCCLFVFMLDTETNNVISCSDETRSYLPEELITDNI